MTKEKIKTEYILGTISLSVLWNLVSTGSGLKEWFADKIEVSGNIYTFHWGDTSQTAKLMCIREGYFVRFHWMDDNEKTFFEFKIDIDELTNDITLVIFDFCLPEEKQDTIELWNNQVSQLKRIAGI
jgi:hypothetical protein